MEVENQKLLDDYSIHGPTHSARLGSTFANGGCLPQLFLCWLKPYLKVSSTTQITQDMHPPLAEHETTIHLSRTFESVWNEISEAHLSQKGSLTSARVLLSTVWRTHRSGLLFRGVFQNILALMEFINSYLIYKAIVTVQMIDYSKDWKDNKDTLSRAMILLGGFVVNTIITSVLNSYLGYSFSVLGVHIKNSISFLILRKVERKNFDRDTTYSIGEITNFIQKDMVALAEFSNFCQDLITFPLKVGLGIVGLFYIGGWAMIPSLAVLALFLFSNLALGLLQTKISKGFMEALDKRSSTLAEIFRNIKFIKTSGLENMYLKRFLDNRIEEMRWVWFNYLRSGLINFSNIFGPNTFLLTFYIFKLYFYETITLQEAFVASITFNIFQMCLKASAFYSSILANLELSWRRITLFLFSEELWVNERVDLGRSSIISEHLNTVTERKDLIRVVGSFYWVDQNLMKQYRNAQLELSQNKKDESKDKQKDDKNERHSVIKSLQISDGTSDINFNLKQIDLKILKGTSVAIIGKLGSGKSSLLSAMLGEMYSHNLPISRLSSVAYMSQKAWIPNGTLRDAIVFGETFDAEKLAAVIRATSLNYDVSRFEGGVDTMLGDQGIELSGGQKARVALARALYSERDVYLLDDPLSALDVQVGKSVFRQAIMEYLRGKTRVVSTHNLRVLKYFDHIVIMDEGRIVEQGTFAQISTSQYYNSIRPSLEEEEQELLRKSSILSMQPEARKLAQSNAISRFSDHSIKLRKSSILGSIVAIESVAEMQEQLVDYFNQENQSDTNFGINWDYIKSVVSYAGGLNLFYFLFFVLGKQ